MPGAVCPKCGKMTFYDRGDRRECSKCGYKVFKSVNSGMGGKGKRCPICGRYTWFDKRCRSCGAHE